MCYVFARLVVNRPMRPAQLKRRSQAADAGNGVFSLIVNHSISSFYGSSSFIIIIISKELTLI